MGIRCSIVFVSKLFIILHYNMIYYECSLEVVNFWSLDHLEYHPHPALLSSLAQQGQFISEDDHLQGCYCFEIFSFRI